MSQAVLDKIMKGKVVAIVRGIPSKDILKLAEAMLAGGVSNIEVTFDQSKPDDLSNTLDAIRALSEKMGDRINVGAGTVMTVEQVKLAKEAGAGYIISPNSDEEVIKATKALDLVSIPGAMTPTEAAQAYAWGADIVKMFPAGVLGAAYIKAIKSPLKHIPMTAVGSVNPQNCAEFFKAGCIGIGVGGNLVSKDLVAAGNFAEITKTAQAYTDALKDF